MLPLYKKLLRRYGRQHWWPASWRDKRWEICAGAVLTQNTAWRNVEKALDAMVKARLTTPQSVARCDTHRLEAAVRSSGFYRQKAQRLKALAKFTADFDGDFYSAATREQLLAIKGIGPETADSMLLYACDQPCFVIDAYTRRFLKRERLASGTESYSQLQELFESALPRDAELYREFHALIVAHEKDMKRKHDGRDMAVARRITARLS